MENNIGLALWLLKRTFLFTFLAIFTVDASSNNVVSMKQDDQYCSFFGNRAPHPQPSLKNCTWYKEETCCRQEEIQATFGSVKPLPGASQSCQKHINYLMCYICAPNQHLFYLKERLTVCVEFCDSWYDACGSAILKGSIIRDLYTSGHDFCKKRRFEVESLKDGRCFYFDPMLDKDYNSGFAICINVFIWIMTMLMGNIAS